MLYHATVTARNGQLTCNDDVICCAVPAGLHHAGVGLFHEAWRLLGMPGTFTTALEPLCAVLALLFRHGLSRADRERMERSGNGIVVISDNGGGTCDSFALYLRREEGTSWCVASTEKTCGGNR